MLPVVGLSIHSGYACRHTGACCTAGWTIPIESEILDRLQRAHASAALVPPDGDTRPWLEFPERSSGYAGLVRVGGDGRCAFLERPAGSPPLCSIHRQHGHEALPVACQQFPRVVVLRPQSIAVSLSHYCPTAAGLLFRGHEPIRVERDSPAFPPERCREGLDLREALPPLLRRDALFSWTLFERWERFVVDVLDDGSRTLGESLDVIAGAAEILRAWTIRDGPFDEWASRHLAEMTRAVRRPSARPADLARLAPRAWALVRNTVPPAIAAAAAFDDFDEAWGQFAAPRWAVVDRPVRRYMAARAWASWAAHEAGGIRGFVRALFVSLGTLMVECARAAGCAGRSLDRDLLLEALRQSDLLLLHLGEPARLASRLAEMDEVGLPAKDL